MNKEMFTIEEMKNNIKNEILTTMLVIAGDKAEDGTISILDSEEEITKKLKTEAKSLIDDVFRDIENINDMTQLVIDATVTLELRKVAMKRINGGNNNEVGL